MNKIIGISTHGMRIDQNGQLSETDIPELSKDPQFSSEAFYQRQAPPQEWHNLEQIYDNLNKEYHTKIAPQDAARAVEDYSSIAPAMIEYHQEPKGLDAFVSHFNGNSDPTYIQEELTEEHISKIANGEIKNATIATINSLTDDYAFVVIRNGELTGMVNGLEDTIPQIVLDFAKDQAAERGESLTVQTVNQYTYGNYTIDDKNVERGHTEFSYRLVNDQGEPIILDITAENEQLFLAGLPFSIGDDIDLTNAPSTSNNNQGNAVYRWGQTHDIINPVGAETVRIASLLPFKLENDMLSTEDPGFNLEVYNFQIMAAQMANTIPGLDIDLGNYRISQDNAIATYGEQWGALGEYPQAEGADGHFGPMTQQSVMQIQTYLGLDVTGVVDQNLINEMEEQYISYQKAQFAGQNVEFINPDGTREIQKPEEQMSRDKNSIDNQDLIAASII